MPALQFLWSKFDWPEPETCQKVQESNTVRSAFRRRGPNGVLRFYATAAKLQATIAGLCGRQAQKLNDVNISTAAASLFRYV
ncbi:hypothetical protein ACLKA6_012015 [Drosophila palustris]